MSIDSSRMREHIAIERDAWLDDDGILHRRSTNDSPHELIRYRFNLKIEKRWGPWTYEQIAAGRADKPYEIFEHEGNLLMTAGATALWNGLSTAGLATPFNTTNAQIAVGDSTTAASAGQTDMSAALGTKLNDRGHRDLFTDSGQRSGGGVLWLHRRGRVSHQQHVRDYVGVSVGSDTPELGGFWRDHACGRGGAAGQQVPAACKRVRQCSRHHQLHRLRRGVRGQQCLLPLAGVRDHDGRADHQSTGCTTGHPVQPSGHGHGYEAGRDGHMDAYRHLELSIMR